MPDVLGTLNQVLSDRPFLEGEEFTVGDVAVGAYLLYIPLFFPTVRVAQLAGAGQVQAHLPTTCTAPMQSHGRVSTTLVTLQHGVCSPLQRGMRQCRGSNQAMKEGMWSSNACVSIA